MTGRQIRVFCRHRAGPGCGGSTDEVSRPGYRRLAFLLVSLPEWRLPAGDMIIRSRWEGGGRRGRGEELLGKDRREHMVHPSDRVANRHGAQGVDVVAGADCHQPVPRLAPTLPVLHGQLDCDLPTETDPESHRNTFDKSPGVTSASSSASSTAGR